LKFENDHSKVTRFLALAEYYAKGQREQVPAWSGTGLVRPSGDV
jgi:hypothetical protein